MAARTVIVLRFILALELAGSLLAWGVGLCSWQVADLIATGTLVLLMLTWDEPRGEPVPESRPHCRARSPPSRYW